MPPDSYQEQVKEALEARAENTESTEADSPAAETPSSESTEESHTPGEQQPDGETTDNQQSQQQAAQNGQQPADTGGDSSPTTEGENGDGTGYTKGEIITQINELATNGEPPAAIKFEQHPETADLEAVIDHFGEHGSKPDPWGERKASAEERMNTRGVLTYLDQRTV